MTKEEFFEKNAESFLHWEELLKVNPKLECGDMIWCSNCYYNSLNNYEHEETCDDFKKDWPLFKRKMKLKKLLS